MPSVIESVAAAVLAQLEAGTFSQQFARERSYADWELAPEKAPAHPLRVDVVPWPEVPCELHTRGKLAYDVAVDIVVRQRFDGQDLDQEKAGRVKLSRVDELVALVLEINEFFVQDRFAEFQDAAWESTRIKMLFHPGHLRTKQQFTGAVRLTFQAVKALA